MDKHVFAACMKRNREKHGITFENLAEKTGITIDKLIEFESGEFEQINASELEKIGKAIDVPMVFLMKGGGTYHIHNRLKDGSSYCEWVEY